MRKHCSPQNNIFNLCHFNGHIDFIVNNYKRLQEADNRTIGQVLTEKHPSLKVTGGGSSAAGSKTSLLLKAARTSHRELESIYLSSFAYILLYLRTGLL
jgi:hypothetical protein